MSFDPAVLRLCLVTDRPLAGVRSLAGIAEAAVHGGVTMVQLREKTASTRAFLRDAEALKAVLRPRGIPLLINDRVDVALAVDADGVHVGQDDMPTREVRRLLGPGKIIGLSITSLDDLDRSDVAAADYLGVGPVYQQATKPDATPALGLDGLAAVRRASAKPMVAIGGIGSGNAAAVMAIGVEGLAVVSAIVAAPDPETAARILAGLTRD